MLTALVIDEDVAVCESLCQLLGLLDITPRPAYNPRAAHLCLGENPPDLIFLSTCLADDAQQEVMNTIRGDERISQLPIILVSDGTACPDVENAIDVIPRPATLEAVEKSIRRAGLF